jgi:DNA replication protein DnaC
LFCDYAGLLKQIQASYSPTAETTEQQLLQPVLGAEVLVLDDLGSTKPTAWVLDTIAYVLNSRYNEKRTTIVTTNFPNRAAAGGREDTLGDRIGERIRSRLMEMCATIEVLGEDFRQTAGVARFAWSAAEWLPPNQ